MNVYDFDLVANFRDVAGTFSDSPHYAHSLQVGDGFRMKRNLLFRCGGWTVATDADIQKLSVGFGIKTYIDLRVGSGFEAADGKVYDLYPPSPCPFRKEHGKPEFQDRKPGQCRRIHVDLCKNLEPKPHSQDCAEERFRSHAEAMLTGAIGKSKVLDVLNVLADENNYPVAFGCTAGKDRTGVIGMLVQKVLGVDDRRILDEYMHSNLCNGHQAWTWEVARVEWVEALKVNDPRAYEALAEKDPGFATRPRPTMENINNADFIDMQDSMVYVSIIRKTLDVIKEAGGIHKYLADIGFDEAKIHQLRNILVEQCPA